MVRNQKFKKLLFVSLFPFILAACGKNDDGVLSITNVSYDPTRELYERINPLFVEFYEENYGESIRVVQSHGGSGAQARSVVEGSDADVVSLALEHDITLIEGTGLIDEGWKNEFPLDSSPYTSTIVFLVRKDNEKNIQDWDDLIREGVEVITPDPKTSGGAAWNFLAALAYAKENRSTEQEEEEFLRRLYQNVSVMDSGARGATTTFVENGKGDVLISWENEAIATVRNYPDSYEIISPSVSILAQPSVAVVDDNARINQTEELSKRYLDFLYTEEAQKIAAEEGYRPSNEEILAQYGDSFDLNLKLWSIDDFGGWDNAYQLYFDDNAMFDRIYNY